MIIKEMNLMIVDKFLIPNTSDAEQTSDFMILLQNGFKCRTTDTGVNESGGQHTSTWLLLKILLLQALEYQLLLDKKSCYNT
jgi:hypothetical protein